MSASDEVLRFCRPIGGGFVEVLEFDRSTWTTMSDQDKREQLADWAADFLYSWSETIIGHK